MSRSTGIAVMLTASLLLVLTLAGCDEAPKVGAARAPNSPCLCAATPSAAAASSGGAIAAQEGAIAAPSQGEPVDEDDERVPVQLAVFGIALTVAIIGVLGYLLRRALGLDRLPPPEDEASHH